MKVTHRILLLALQVILSHTAEATPLQSKVVSQAAARIDGLLGQELKRSGLMATPTIDDATFLRRAYLGIIGRIPSETESRAFLADTSPNRRSTLIDQLTASPGFDSHLFNWTADLIRVQSRQEQFGLGWHVWLRQSVAEDKPWDKLVTEMLGATGHCSAYPAVGYYLRDRNMQLDNFSNTMRIFLGRQIGCAQCHDHPFDTWTQYEYYQMAAFSGGIEYRSAVADDFVKKTINILTVPRLEAAPTIAVKDNQAEKQLRKEQQIAAKNYANILRPLFKDFSKNAIFDSGTASLRLPQDYKYRDAKPKDIVPPETLFGEKLVNIAPEARLASFSSWITSPNNPFFTKVIANRLWARTFGYGLVEPIDDWQDDSSSAHTELIACLEDTMKGAKYDVRQFLRILYHTQLFQRECLTDEPTLGVPLAFQGPVMTRMSAEQIFDSFLVLTRDQFEDNASPVFAKNWDTYRAQVAGLLKSEPHELLVLAEAAKQGEAAQRTAQSEQRVAQKALADAKTPEEKKKAQDTLTVARDKGNEARKQADPLSSMQMNYGGGDGKVLQQDTLRASEYPAPFQLGTLIRTFGGSDRQTPSSSDDTATVPQALTLLNDYKTDIVTSKKSRVGQTLFALKAPDARLDCLFINLFSRYPSPQEKEKYTSLVSDPKTLRDLARAMLTSNSFIFIQ